MNVVDQGFDDRLAVLELRLARTDGIAKLALDDRVHGFGFPPLSEKAIQTGGGDQIGSGFSLRIDKFAMSSDRRNNVRIMSSELSFLVSKPASASTSQVRCLVSL